MFNNTDNEWEKFGKQDPYFGVLTHEKYRKSELTKENKDDFFKSGYSYIDDVLIKIRQYIDSSFTIKRALDFGCGVGRLVVPLTNCAEKVVGVDVSESMLNEAKKNCKDLSIKNATFIKNDDNLSSINNKFNFIHSFIVFQHIPVKRGLAILKQLLSFLEDGGIGVLHFTYAKDNNTAIKKIMSFVEKYIPFTREFIDFVKGRPIFVPQMQMNMYNLNELLYIIQKSSISEFHTEFTDHAGALGIIIYFKKSTSV